MESTTLASSEDAGLILKLYELRREPVMRAARHWLLTDFWPQGAQDVLFVLAEFGSQHNQYLRQVLGYWEMASSFVLRGALDADLFVECNGENLFIYAKFQPYLAEIREKSPDFMVRTEQVIQKHAVAKGQVERISRGQEALRRDAVKATPPAPSPSL